MRWGHATMLGKPFKLRPDPQGESKTGPSGSGCDYVRVFVLYCIFGQLCQGPSCLAGLFRQVDMEPQQSKGVG